MPVKRLIYFVFVFAFSCRSKEELFVQAEYDKLVGSWSINSFTVSGNVSDDLKSTLKTGEMLLHSCDKYSTKSAKNNTFCGGGEFQINEFIYSLSNNYDYATNLFKFGLGVYDTNSGFKPLSPVQININTLIQGQWELTVSDNKLIAKQIKNTALSNAQVSFIATRK